MLVGHQKQWDFLRNSAKSGRGAHAYLFYGPSEIGKKRVALELIKLLNCQNPKEVPCQECLVCRGIEKDIFPDFLLVKPENLESEATAKPAIHIDQIRELRARLFLSSANSGYKAAIIDDAHHLTFEAQGALLKILEEPKGKTLIILLAQYADQLLPTIVSRCQTIRFSLIKRQEIERYLLAQKVPLKRAKEVSWFSFGKPGLAIEYLGNQKEEKFLRDRIKEVIQLTTAPLNVRFQYAQKLSKARDDLNKTLEIWLNYFRAILLGRLGGENAFSVPRNSHYSFKHLEKTIGLIEQMRFLIASTNVNPRLALEILLMRM